MSCFRGCGCRCDRRLQRHRDCPGFHFHHGFLRQYSRRYRDYLRRHFRRYLGFLRRRFRDYRDYLRRPDA